MRLYEFAIATDRLTQTGESTKFRALCEALGVSSDDDARNNSRTIVFPVLGSPQLLTLR